MSTTNTTSDKKSVDPSLWWDPFASLLTDLENAPLSSDLPHPLARKLKDNHAWFVDTVSLFKPPSAKSRDALNSNKLVIGPHELTLKPELKDKALQISSYLCLDEVQSYIIVERSLQRNGLAINSVAEEYLHVALIQYYIERQCLLKCTRRILMHALYIGIRANGENVVKNEALKLISDGLEQKLISVLQDLLSTGHPENMDADLFTLWAEETLIEDNLVLDILFLIYYESLHTCNGDTWKKLCLLYKGILSGAYNLGKLEVSTEALKSSYHAKVQLLLILIESLDLENLLQLVHDAIPFSQGSSIFSFTDIQEMDALVSTFDIFEMKEAGPLILTWAVYLCLISSLPGKEENNVLMEIDHIGYVRQAFEGASLNYFLEILDSNLLQESDGPIAGYRSILRTFISAFIASYEINLQLEDGTLNLILDILCKIYRGEESLCVQFWDRESFIDSPIRCLLCSLEGEFPIRISELVRLLSSLCEGSWPAECVHNFLDKSVGISTLFDITNESLVDNSSQIVETRQTLYVPGFESLLIPSKTRGHVLKVIGGNTALVRWEHAQSGMIILLLRLAKELYFEGNEEVLLILDLLSRMVSFSMAVTFSLMEIGNPLNFDATGMDGQLERRLWVAEVICAVIKNLHPNAATAAVMSLGVCILSKMLRCAPSSTASISLKANIFEMATRTSIFDIGHDGSPSGSWLLSGKLAKMLLVDSEENDNDNPLTISVLDFTIQLLETNLEDDLVLALVAFVLQYILVNHEYWRYKAKHVRWRITLKVLEVMKKCVKSISIYEKIGLVIRDMLLSDSSIHNTLFRLVCVTKQTLEKLYVSRLFELTEIEGFQHAICSALDILYIMVSKFSKDISSSMPVFYQAVLSSTTKPVPIVTAMMSLVSYFHNPAMQVCAAKVLSKLLIMADYLQPYLPYNLCFGLDDGQIGDVRHVIKRVLLERLEWNEDLLVAIINLLTSAARYQPAFLVALVPPEEDAEVCANDNGGSKETAKGSSIGMLGFKKSSLLDALVQYVERLDDLITSNPRVLLTLLEFLRALWQGAAHYMHILECLKNSGWFWKQISKFVLSVAKLKAPSLENMTEADAQGFQCKYQCQSAILEIMACEVFLTKKLLHAESLQSNVTKLNEGPENAASKERMKSTNDGVKEILSNWSEKSTLLNMLESYASSGYDNGIVYHVKVAASLFVVHIMEKLEVGNTGSLAVSLLQKIRGTLGNMRGQPAFSELLAQYSQRGYSAGKQLEHLILSDLFYHLQGALEGREIGPGPFKELSQFLIESNCMLSYRLKNGEESFAILNDIYLYDLTQIRLDIGLSMWDHTEWKQSKTIAKSMLDCMQKVNSMVLLASSKVYSLRALTAVLVIYEDESLEKRAKTGSKIPSQVCLSCIEHLCQCFHDMVSSLDPVVGTSREILNLLAAQAELLMHLVRFVQSNLPASVALLILRTSGFGLKILFESSVRVEETRRLLLMLLLLTVEFMEVSDMGSDDIAEISNVCLGLLPILCNCIAASELYALSLAATDLILRSLLTPSTWFPIIFKHLQWEHIVLKLQEQSSFASVQITLKFLLTLARFKGGAEMLLNAGLFSSLRVLFANFTDCSADRLPDNNNIFLKSSDKIEKPQQIWGLGLAVITAVVHSMGDSSLNRDIVDNVIFYLFSEKAYLISYYLSAPDFPSDHHEKKRPRAQRIQTSLTALTETEHTLMLICTLAKHTNSWAKAMKEIDVQLREKSVHLLAFISQGSPRLGESPSRTVAPLLCPPVVNGEFDCCKKPSFIKSRNGWFSLSPRCCLSNSRFASFSANSTVLVIRGQSTESTDAVSPTHFSDLVALQIYRIAFFLLKFLSLEAESAAKRCEEVGFVDPAYVPELPMPEILHGLQDQAVTIVSELCDASKSKRVDPEEQSACLLLVQIMEMALYLEFCVIQICGIRPVMGRLEDFSKGAKLLLKAMEGHAFLNASSRSLKQIISLVYPGLLQSEGFL